MVETRICPEFRGEWGQKGICTIMEGARRSIPDINCTSSDQKEYAKYAPGGEMSGQVIEGEDLLIAKASRCVWISSNAGKNRGAVPLPVLTNPSGLRTSDYRKA